MATSKRHHFIPAFYLAGFTDGEDRDSPFWCAGKDGKKIFQDTPNNACVENNYYTLTESPDPMAVEKMYADLEANMAAVLRYIKENNWTPRPIDEAFLHIFAATLYLRVPEFRERNAIAIHAVYDRIFDMLFRDPRLLRNQVQKTFENGFISRMPSDSEISAMYSEYWVTVSEKISGNIDNNSPSVSRDVFGLSVKNTLLKIELELISIAKLLAHRRWFLYFVHECEKCEFITSDNPFVLISAETEAKMAGLMSMETGVFIPLHKRAALFGVFEDGPSCTYHAPKERVAEINELVHRGCNR